MAQGIHGGRAAAAASPTFRQAAGGPAVGAAGQLTRRPQIVNGMEEGNPVLTSFMARLLKRSPRTGRPSLVCGGARITERHIVTAGHCTARVGDQVAVGGTAIDGGLRYTVTAVFVPPGGSAAGAKEGILDIAIVEYDADAPLNAAEAAAEGGKDGGTAVTPASLRVARVPSSAKNVTIGDKVTTLGWGAVYPESIGELFGPSRILRSVTTSVTPDDVCALAYMSVAKTQPPYMFCAAGNESGPCAGDSGGPAGYFPGDGKGFVIQGVVSATISSLFYRCEPDAPSFYTEIGFFYDWMVETVKPLRLST
ncbi:hypothetical protein BU14_0292s0017 [Porphyra umbilicalis]|uniref:Peptidase S1 domain-containing protein n=1 Tax=Porphyra umbilicalis TaxID=2786 RepID=A0A1X6P0I5_PORUM|nr:hypothetical protein BU14_0292s0017 [Porphyra umbilicalis]|eukprot:OSX74374.1 hypothetical protein BU14_0292s0017 [Porphyra umbilicalis]